MNDLIFIMQESGWGMDLIRSIFFWLDRIVYTVFSWVMQLIFDIVEVSSSPALRTFYDDIYTNIYTILAIFMLFKVTISMLNYLVNPDAITDKERGAGKLVSRIIITLIMLIAFSNVFGILYRFQPLLLSALPRIVLGTESTSNDVGNEMATEGASIAFSVYNGVWFNTNQVAEDYESSFDGIADSLNHDSGGEYLYDYYPLIGMVVGIVMIIIVVGICIDVAIRVFKLMILEIIAPIPIISYIDPKSSKDGAFSKWVKMVTSVYLELFLKMGIVYFVVLVIRKLITAGVVINVANDLFGQTGGLRGSLVLVALVIGLLFFAKDAPKFIADALGVKMNENNSIFGGLGKLMAAGAITAGAIGSNIAAARASYDADEANGKNHNIGRLIKNAGAGLFGGVVGGVTGISAATKAKDHYAKAAADAMMKRNARISAAAADGGTTLGGATSFMRTLVSGQSDVERMEADWKAEEEAIKYEKQRNAERKTIIDRASSKGLESLKTSASINGFTGATGTSYTFTANAAQFNSAYEAAKSGVGLYKDTWYEDGYGTRLTEAEYNALSDAEKASGAFARQESAESYFNFNGQKIAMTDAQLLQHEINDGNIADYAEKALSRATDTSGNVIIDDPVITGANQRFASTTEDGSGVETTFGGTNGLKGTYGSVNNDISEREMNIANQRNSQDTRRQQANDKRFRGNGS